MQAAALAEVAGRRSRTYWLLSRLVGESPDAALLGELAKALPEVQSGADAPLGMETDALVDAVAGLGSESAAMTELMVDWTRLFGALGERHGAPAPYESVARKLTLPGESAAAVAAIYAAAALDPARPGDGPADSLATELRFLALACYEEMQAWLADDRATAGQWIETERQFLDDHVLQWVPQHCALLRTLAGTAFYAAVSALVGQVCLIDRDDVEELAGHAGAAVDTLR